MPLFDYVNNFKLQIGELRTLTGDKRQNSSQLCPLPTLSPTHPPTLNDTRCERLNFLIYRQQ